MEGFTLLSSTPKPLNFSDKTTLDHLENFKEKEGALIRMRREILKSYQLTSVTFTGVWVKKYVFIQPPDSRFHVQDFFNL